ncbi:sec-independent protein translocase protein TatB [Phenylobacterium haematophilum]|uniref:Sec-independent protein translocase protein TatB n=1 Tax=Phenylobacterium haematophilum TaxID=98513 RepID=A0A839ZW14_9CAUL|nr:Sec-independent protein translocase protein TatB [Phenylobacterium haematophilum]MBB3889593.1 sec-independent protein translocase protein TatB [Phenylobacterium haematophilum]
MLPEIGGLELLVIAAVALIVVGPKDLPVMLRKLGQFTAKIRGMANEFRASFDEMARQSELDELRKEVEAMRRGQLADVAAADASKAQVDQVFKEIGDSLEGGGVRFPPSVSPAYEPPAPAIESAPETAPAPIVEEAKPRARRAAKPKSETAAKPKAAAKSTKAKPKAGAKA